MWSRFNAFRRSRPQWQQAVFVGLAGFVALLVLFAVQGLDLGFGVGLALYGGIMLALQRALFPRRFRLVRLDRRTESDSD